jgi:phage virion morphogenesis protein
MVTITLHDEEALRVIGTLRRRARDMTPFFSEVGEIVRSSIIRNFEEGGRPEAWTPTRIRSIYSAYRRKGRKAYTLKGALRKAFQRHAGSKKTLIDTADLMNSINARPYPDRVEIGTAKRYAAIHQFGGMAGRNRKVRIPPRPYLLVQDEDWTEIKKELGNYLTEE